MVKSAVIHCQITPPATDAVDFMCYQEESANVGCASGVYCNIWIRFPLLIDYALKPVITLLSSKLVRANIYSLKWFKKEFLSGLGGCLIWRVWGELYEGYEQSRPSIVLPLQIPLLPLGMAGGCAQATMILFTRQLKLHLSCQRLVDIHVKTCEFCR